MGKQNSITQLSRALFELRSGRAIAIDGHCYAAVELVQLSPDATLIAAEGVAEALLPKAAHLAKTATERLAIDLVKRAGMLPALVKLSADKAYMPFKATELREGLTASVASLIQGASAELPLKTAQNAQVTSFRSIVNGAEHLAIIVGDPAAQKAPFVRIHSSCITGDLLGSLRCDCGDQLQLALRMIAAQGHGVVCYLQQEGRGIGISNKIRAYHLQDEGLDTYDANLALGFKADERDFSMAAEMLKAFNLTNITLLSNNPDKAAQLKKFGITIAALQPLRAEPTEQNAHYLTTKASRFGHTLS